MAAKTDFNVTPYWDDFDTTDNFYRVLFRPGFAVQARELTQLQTILQNQIAQFGNHVFKEGAIVIDVGINRIKSDNEKGYKLVGDANWESIRSKVSAATPVPGGVGPMTIAMLVENTIEAAEKFG